ncbi:MAG: beta-glucuronidase, partial [Pseudonocardiales bacterium]|nr:beta-glucuronidase [Pseudonocardiales bacterium]
FRADPAGVGREQEWFAAPLADAIDMPVPASYNDIVPGRALHDHVGEVWYQSRVRVPHTWGDQRIVLRFDSATHRATVWVDGHEVMHHEGGYTPFEADVTDLVRAGVEVLVTAAVDNVLTWETIPPGIVVDTPRGRRQKYMHDFFNYAGLHRPVWLYATPTVHLDSLRVFTDVDDPLADPVAATVGYRAEISGDGDVRVRARLLDADGTEVGTASGADATIALAAAHLWQPGEGYLYDLVVELVDAEDALVDSYRQPVGIRTVEIRGTEFLINGAPFYFRGFGMHEDHAVLGKGHENAAMVHDFELLKWIGANSFRTSHYPYSEEILDYADAHGIVVIDETAAVGMNATVAAVLGTRIDRVYGPDAISDRTAQTHAQAIRELIERDRNRPSVVIWSIANEPESHTDGAVRYFSPLFALARSLDDTRPVGFVNVQFSPAGQCKLTALSDLVMINRYYGWYVDTGDLAAAEDALDAELTEWAKEGKPILVTEFGADAVAGLHTVSGAMWSEEYQTEIVDMSLRVFDRHPAVRGEHLWNFADFQTSLGIVRVDGNKKGAFTRDRRPKAVAHMLRKRWTGGTTPATPQD